MPRTLALALAFLLGVGLARADEPGESRLALRIRAATQTATKAIGKRFAAAEKVPSAFNFVQSKSQVKTLVALTLTRAGGPAEKELAAKLLDEWWQDCLAGAATSQTGNYELALAISALEGLTVDRIEEAHPTTVTRYEAKPIAKEVAARLEAATAALLRGRSITANGKGCAWSYPMAPIVEGETVSAVPSGGETTQTRARRPRAPMPAAFDNSNTQFSVLALHDAARGGIKIPHEIAVEVAEHFLACEPALARSPDGPARWGYVGMGLGGAPSFAPTNPRTTNEQNAGMYFAGLSSLAIARDLGVRTKDVTVAIERGLLGVKDFIQAFEKPFPQAHEGGGGTAYGLYSLEKALDTLELEKIDGRDWFPSLAERVLAAQDSEGLWGQGDVIDSCFCVLFLTRATISKKRLVDRRSTGAGASASPGEVYLPRSKKTVDALELASDYASAEGPATDRARAAFDEALHALAAEGHGREACLLGPLATLLTGTHKDQAARWLRELAGRNVTAAEASTAGERFAALVAAEDPKLLAQAVHETSLLLPLRAFAASALVGKKGASASVLLDVGDALASDPLLETPAGSRCARAIGFALTGILCADLGTLPDKVSPDDLRRVVATAREKLAKGLDLHLDRALEARARREADPAAWKSARTELRDLGGPALDRLLARTEDPAKAPAAFALLRDVTGELIPDDRDAWRSYLRSRP